MAKGFATAKDAFAEIEARKNSGGGGFGPYFKLSRSGDSATVRFVDEEVDWAWVHELPAEPGKYSKTELCRDQDLETGQRNGEACQGCDQEMRRKMQGNIRLIQRDAPVYAKDESTGKYDYNTVVGTDDQVVRWTVGKVVLEELEGTAATFGPLNNRDYTVTRRGTGLDTSYDIKPVVVDGETVKSPFSDNDKKLVEEAKPVEFKIPSFDDWGKQKKGGSNDAPATSVGDKSPFKKRTEG